MDTLVQCTLMCSGLSVCSYTSYLQLIGLNCQSSTPVHFPFGRYCCVRICSCTDPLVLSLASCFCGPRKLQTIIRDLPLLLSRPEGCLQRKSKTVRTTQGLNHLNRVLTYMDVFFSELSSTHSGCQWRPQIILYCLPAELSLNCVQCEVVILSKFCRQS